MKKITAIFVMAIMILSIMPTIFAAPRDQEQRQPIREKALEQIKQRIENNPNPKVQKALEVLQQEFNKEKVKVQRRILTNDKIQEARNRFEAAKEKLKNVLQLQKQRLEQFRELKAKAGECNDNGSAECEQWHAEIQENAQNYVLRSIEAIKEQLNKIKEKVEAEENLDPDKAAEIVENIENALAELESLKEKAEAAETKEEVKAVAKETAQYWKRMKLRARLYAARIVNAQVGKIINRNQGLAEKLTCTVDKMAEEGLETDELYTLLGQYSEKVSEAERYYNEHLELFVEAKEENDSELAEEAKENLKNSHDALDDAHDILKEVLKRIKEKGYSISDCNAVDPDDDEDETADEEDEEESDDDEESGEEDNDEIEDEENEDDEEDDTESCESDEDCTEEKEVCVENVCVEEDDTCESDTDCTEEGEICVDGECEDSTDDEQDDENNDKGDNDDNGNNTTG